MRAPNSATLATGSLAAGPQHPGQLATIPTAQDLQAAAGAGYEEPFPTTRMLKKAGAATRIAAKWKLEFRRRSIARSSA